MLLKVRLRRRRRLDEGVELSIADQLPKKFVSFPPKDGDMRLWSTQQPAALTARRLIECNQPCTNRKCHEAQIKKNTQRCGQTHAYLAIKASISARNAANSCSDLLRTKVPWHSLDFRVSASFKSQWNLESRNTSPRGKLKQFLLTRESLRPPLNTSFRYISVRFFFLGGGGWKRWGWNQFHTNWRCLDDKESPSKNITRQSLLLHTLAKFTENELRRTKRYRVCRWALASPIVSGGLF